MPLSSLCSGLPLPARSDSAGCCGPSAATWLGLFGCISPALECDAVSPSLRHTQRQISLSCPFRVWVCSIFVRLQSSSAWSWPVPPASSLISPSRCLAFPSSPTIYCTPLIPPRPSPHPSSSFFLCTPSYVDRRPRTRISLSFIFPAPSIPPANSSLPAAIRPHPFKMVSAKITTLVVLVLAAADAAVSTIVVTKPVA